ncbi:hypothetical protein D3C87_1843540 [compost metagenome]
MLRKLATNAVVVRVVFKLTSVQHGFKACIHIFDIVTGLADIATFCCTITVGRSITQTFAGLFC